MPSPKPSMLPNFSATAPTSSAPTSASPTSAEATPAPSSTRSIPVDGQTKQILWVKGSGGDLGSIKRAGFATLYLDKLLALEKAYAGVEREDEMVDMYPLCTFGNNPVAASIDTPLHGYLPFPHVDHLHPDWGIALAASSNGKLKMEEFNQEFGHKLAWLPWQRPGFELGMMLRKIVVRTPPVATASSSAATDSSPGAKPSANPTSPPSPSSIS